MADISLVNVAREIEKAGRILDHQLEAIEWLDKQLTAAQRAGFQEIWRRNDPVFLFLQPTLDFEGGLRVWDLQLRRGQVVVDRVKAYSGAPGRQDLIDPRQDRAGSQRPINPGRYRIGPIEIAPSGSWGEGLGSIWIDLIHENPVNNRRGFGFHLDANRSYAPGSAGCVVFKNQSDLERLCRWLKQRTRPAYLEVTHNLPQTGGGYPESVLLAEPLIREFEGCSLTAYPDPLSGGEPWTIGWGITEYPDGRKVRRGDRISREQAEHYLRLTIVSIDAFLRQRIPNYRALPPNRQAALISFSYNLGRNWYGSPGFASLTRAIKEQKYEDVPRILELYRNPGTKVEAGLLRRRRAEGALWNRR